MRGSLRWCRRRAIHSSATMACSRPHSGWRREIVPRPPTDSSTQVGEVVSPKGSCGAAARAESPSAPAKAVTSYGGRSDRLHPKEANPHGATKSRASALAASGAIACASAEDVRADASAGRHDPASSASLTPNFVASSAHVFVVAADRPRDRSHGGVRFGSAKLPSPPYTSHPTDALQPVPYPPPAARVEDDPVRPTEEAVWIDGEWIWQTRRWVWRRGRWVRPVPVPGTRHGRACGTRTATSSLPPEPGGMRAAASSRNPVVDQRRGTTLPTAPVSLTGSERAASRRAFDAPSHLGRRSWRRSPIPTRSP